MASLVNGTHTPKDAITRLRMPSIASLLICFWQPKWNDGAASNGVAEDAAPQPTYPCFITFWHCHPDICKTNLESLSTD